MKISTTLRLGTGLIAALVLASLGAGFFLMAQVRKATEKQVVVEKIVQGVFKAGLLRSEYIANPGERVKTQWIIISNAQSKIVDESLSIFTLPEEKALFDNIREISESTQPIFEQLVLNIEQGGSGELTERLSSQLAVKAQERFTDALRLAELSRKEVATAERTLAVMLLVLGLLIMGVVAGFNVVGMTIGKSLTTLQQDFTRIAALDFSSTTTTTTTTTTTRKDELGVLSRAFNTMVGKLRESYGSLEVKAKELAVIAKEREDTRKKLVETAKKLATTAEEKENVRIKLVVTAEELAVIAEEKEAIRRELVVTTNKLAREEKLATIGKLAGIMGHEIRNPLGVIRNSIYFLTMKFKESMDEKVKRHMGIMETEIVAADKIISDVLDFARTRPPSFSEAEINSVVEASLSKISIPKTIKIQTDLGENLPKINIDIAQIQQIFSNLIANAIEAMPKGGELRVTTAQTDSFIFITLKDTGVGIPKENIDKLFTPLFSTKTKGLGLGLAACQNIINAHQGKIEFESQEGQGTTFTIKLPIKN